VFDWWRHAKLTSGSDVWSCNHLHTALYLLTKFGANIFDHSGDIAIFLNSIWQNSILLTFPPRLPLESNTRKNPGKQLKETWREPEDKNPHFLYTRLILDVMRSLVNHWSPLTHASHGMTTSRPAATARMRARVSPAMHFKVFYTGCLSCRNPSYFWDWKPAQDRLACIPEARLTFNSYITVINYYHFLVFLTRPFLCIFQLLAYHPQQLNLHNHHLYQVVQRAQHHLVPVL